MTAALELPIADVAAVPGVRVVYRPADVLPKPKRKRKAPEKDVERHVDSLYAACGVELVRFSQARATRQTEGIPDRKAYHMPSGITFWLELKAPGGRQSHDQEQFEAQARRCHEAYILGGRHEAELALAAIGLGTHRPDGLFIPRPGGWRERTRAEILEALAALMTAPNRYRFRSRRRR